MASSSRIPIDQEEENHSSPPRERSKSPLAGIYHHRQTPEQIARLEESFNQQLNLDENQRNQLAQKLSLSQKQIRCWFDNKKTSKKAEMKQEENGVLRAQNERLLKENMLMKKILENEKCLACCGLSIEDVEKHKHSLQQLKLENAQLKDKAS
ncbi:hypothetical protein RIF29_05030 [Crotalaria pallida]|uniref:Homeobox domain-containing protein n=1 Tax=Crotalaria pallida TaxID=3830 RepID=A0AAN9J2E1_CROPI